MFNDVKQSVLNFLNQRRQQYLMTFDTEPGKEVLADLARFCRASESTFHPDPHVRCQLDGRREVWLRIQQHLNLTDEDLYKLYAQKKGPTSGP